MRLIILPILFCLCNPTFLFAQSLELTIPSGELPSDFSEWGASPGLMHISFVAPGGIQLSGAHIVFEVAEGVEHILVSTRTKYSEQPAFTGMFKKKNLTFDDIAGTDIEVDPALKSASSAIGKLPGGLFSLCMYLVDSTGKQVGTVAQGCMNFYVRDIDPPVLQAPANGGTYSGKIPLAFSWTPANVISLTVHYKLKLYPMYEGQTAEQAMSGSSALYSSDDIFSTSFIYPPDAPPIGSLTKAKSFAWMVTQMDSNGKPIGLNYGRSIPSIFYLQKN